MPKGFALHQSIHFVLGPVCFDSGQPDVAGDDDEQGIVALAGGNDPAAGRETQFGNEVVEAVEFIVREFPQ
jgi:hypothetical protein